MRPAGPEPDVEADRRFMGAAIRLSRSHLGLTGENPSVGALVVADDGRGPVIVGRGVTALGGRPHAEILALAEAGALARGATAYCTLEPCSHIGRSPPCAEALVAAGVSRVVIAVLDPDPRVAGRGVSILSDAGVVVSVGCLQAEATQAMAGFLSLKGRGRPFLTLKLAVSADGKIGVRGAGQVAITGEIARRMVQVERVMHEAIMVGASTVVADDPRLTVRLAGLGQRSPRRVVVDPFARTPPGSEILSGEGGALILASEKAPWRALDALKEAGAAVQFVASDYRGRFDPTELLRALGVLGIKSVFLEGGADTARRFLEADLVDRILAFVGQGIAGDGGVPSPLDPEAPGSAYERIGESRFGADRLIEYRALPW